MCEFLDGLGYEVVGVDISPSAIRFNKADLPNVTFRLIDPIKKLPFADGTVDAIWCSEVIEHLYDVNFTIVEFHRILKPGGLVVVTTPYHGVLKNLSLVLIPGAFERHFDVEADHIRFWSKKSLHDAFRRHGLEAVSWARLGRIPWLAKTWFVVARKTSEQTLIPQGAAAGATPAD
jgi:2-polyprenyl-6-hydroxyphenyl methylase/3-demethylubiquinone-9 3-methyltransferase